VAGALESVANVAVRGDFDQLRGSPPGAGSEENASSRLPEGVRGVRAFVCLPWEQVWSRGRRCSQRARIGRRGKNR